MMMTTKSRLIYKSVSTCFQTFLPVYFYGMSDGRMIVFYTRFRSNDPHNTIQEWVLALHCDFSYDYESDTILTNGLEEIGIEEFMDLSDNFDQRIKTIKTFGEFRSNAEAQKYFTINAHQMLSSLKPIKAEINNYYTDWQL
ncbi:MAG TPA: hypothetical protein VN192_07560 [Flavobacterium sp.]|nr:hypothetical protein [Flavobacterium sp.]